MNDSNQRWLCTVCGYLHQGSEPCDCCPICGATIDLFEPAAPAAPAPATPAVSRWRCLICDHVHAGSAPPACCPICAASADQFEPLSGESVSATVSQEQARVVIVGTGIAGVSAAEAIRQNAPQAQITLLSKESELPYYRLNLTRYLAGEISGDQLPIHPLSWYQENRIQLLPETELRAIDVAAKRLQFRGADDLPYDKLVLAMGAHPFVPPIPGSNRGNVCVLRSRRDADFILEQAKQGGNCVIIGGGLLGLETAAALVRQGLQVTLVEGYAWLMPQQLNQAASQRLLEEAGQLGIDFRLGARIKQLEGDEQVRGVTLDSGETLAADLVVITAGVRANSYVARLARIETNNGILVNNQLRTDQSDIYAAGDVAEHRGVSYGTWGPSQFQGTIAGLNIAGVSTEFAGIPRSNALKVLGSELFSIGRIRPEDGSDLEMEESSEGVYASYLFHDSRLVGAILYGDTRLSPMVKQLIETRRQCDDLLARKAAGGRLQELLTAI